MMRQMRERERGKEKNQRGERDEYELKWRKNHHDLSIVVKKFAVLSLESNS
jgi:hypothetical protein